MSEVSRDSLDAIRSFKKAFDIFVFLSPSGNRFKCSLTGSHKLHS